jgi:hypothetical protein
MLKEKSTSEYSMYQHSQKSKRPKEFLLISFLSLIYLDILTFYQISNFIRIPKNPQFSITIIVFN